MRQIHSSLCPLRAGILLFLLLVSIAAPAQTEVSYRRGATQLEDILPPSPEAASRVKYSDVPFTHSTGAAEYSVPIYELKGLKQGAQSRSRVSGWIGSIPINIIEVVSNGRLKSVKRK